IAIVTSPTRAVTASPRITSARRCVRTGRPTARTDGLLAQWPAHHRRPWLLVRGSSGTLPWAATEFDRDGLAGSTRGKSKKAGGKYLVLAVFVAVLATSAFAAKSYVAFDKANRKCWVTMSKPVMGAEGLCSNSYPVCEARPLQKVEPGV